MAGFSLLLTAPLQASPPSILDDPSVAPGGSILSDPTPICGPGTMATYDPDKDAYGQPVTPADLSPPGSVALADQEVFVDVGSANPQLNGVGVVVRLDGLTPEQANCVPAPRQRRSR